MSIVDVGSIANFPSIRAGGLRNGDPANVVRTARDASLAPKYHYTGPDYSARWRGGTAARLAPLPVPILLNASIRSAYAQMVSAAMDAAASANAAVPPVPAANIVANGGALIAPPDNTADQAVRDNWAAHQAALAAYTAATDAREAARAATVASAATRLDAIVLGSAQAAVVFSYDITRAECNAPEVSRSVFALVGPPAAANAAGYQALMASPGSGWVVRLATGHARAGATVVELAALDMPVAQHEETDLSFLVFKMAQAAPSRAGAMLINTDHHYLTSSNVRHRAIERQVMSAAEDSVKAIFRANEDRFRGLIWHSSVHFVNAELLVTFSEYENAAKVFDAIGLGSAAVGLPAKEDALARASTFLTLFDSTITSVRAAGHHFALPYLRGALSMIMSLSRRGALPAECPAYAGVPAEPWADNVTDRASAITVYLDPAMAASRSVIAWLFGWYREVCLDAGVRVGSPEGSLLRAYSLVKLISEAIADVNAGQQAYVANKRFLRSEAAEGRMVAYDMVVAHPNAPAPARAAAPAPAPAS